jgi:hypothetical protein
VSLVTLCEGLVQLTILVCGFVRSLFFLHGTVVIQEHEGAVVFGVGVALGALVSGAEVALGVVVRQGGLGGTFLCASVFGGD